MYTYDEWKQESDRRYNMISETQFRIDYECINSVGFIDFTGSNSRTVNKNGLDDYQIIYILEGFGHYTINNVKFEASQGDIVIIPKNTPHKYNYNSQDNTKVYFIHFSGKAFDRIMSSSRLEYFYSIGIQNKLCERFSEILKTLQKKQFLFKEIALSLAFSLVCETISLATSHKSVIPCKLSPAITHINLHPEDNLSLDDYAKMCILSVSCFSREFKKYTTLPPVDYRNKTRIDKAVKLLIDSNIPISEISSSLGFSSYPQFFKQFKRFTGTTPKKFRQSNQTTI